MAILGILLICYSSRGHQMVFDYPPSSATATSSLTSSQFFSHPLIVPLLNKNSKTTQPIDAVASNKSDSGSQCQLNQIDNDIKNQKNWRRGNVSDPDGGSKFARDRHSAKNRHGSNGVESHMISHGKDNHSSHLLPNQNRNGCLNAKSGLNKIHEHDSLPSISVGTISANGNNNPNTPYDQHVPFKETFLGFESQTLSDLLSPKVALCDRKFELTIDHVTFVGHATLLNADRPGTGNRFARSIQKRHMLRSMYDASRVSTPSVSLTPLTSSFSAPTSSKIVNGQVFNFPDHHSTRSSSSHASTPIVSNSSSQEFSTPLNSSIPQQSDHLMPPSQNIRLNSSTDFRMESREAIVEAGESNPHKRIAQSTLTMFNLVVALTPTNESRNSSQIVDLIYSHIIAKVTAALKYEQLKRSFIKKEAELILSLKEQCYPLLSSGKMTVDEMTRLIISSSSLASNLSQLYHEIITTGVSRLMINNSMDVSIRLPSPHLFSDYQSLSHQQQQSSPNYLQLQQNPKALHQQKMRNEDYGHNEIHDATAKNAGEYPNIYPYHALLLLADPEEILRNLPFDCSPILALLIEIVTPTQSLEELQVKLDCSLAHLYRLAAHLVYWKQAKIINVISTKNVYVPSPTADLSQLSRHQIVFSGQFPNLKLLDILSDLDVPKPFSAIIPSKEYRTLYLEALTYLLRNDLVVHLHMYVYVQVPKRIVKEVSLSGTFRNLMESSFTVNQGLTGLTPIQSASIKPPSSISSAFVEFTGIPHSTIGISNGGNAATSSSIEDKNTVGENIDQINVMEALNSREESNHGNTEVIDEFEDYIIPDTENLSEIEQLYINTICQTQEPPLNDAFARLVKYFNGLYQVDEILILENISRKDFRNVLSGVVLKNEKGVKG